ncbi:MAG TPA: 2-oxo-4-hydroxy-4-carboxy-5-ureidoimidazoline decarboxylase, partial [Thermoanaerobaculia bacterium]|nr:2-oxo-4-hydroxy-4-carboxy-5-ureidoimidazoline decarboxylase [Thermoanaerobaculia bacterium]
AEEIWWQLTAADWLEAFAAHPRIGERAAGESTSARWSAGEQAGATAAADDVKQAIAAGNRRYEERFGHVFLISAAGRSGSEILAALERRLANEPQRELHEAAAEQAAITRLRLERLLGE